MFSLAILYVCVALICAYKLDVGLERKSESETATIIFTGDIYFDGPVKYFAEVAKTCDYLMPFSKLRGILADADLRVGNLESPLVGRNPEVKPALPRKGVHHRGSLKGIEGLKYARFDIMQLANNHMNDYGDAGVQSTVRALTNAGIDFVGLRGNYYEKLSVEKHATMALSSTENITEEWEEGTSAEKSGRKIRNLVDHFKSRGTHPGIASSKKKRLFHGSGSHANKDQEALAEPSALPDKNRQKPLIKVVNGLKIGFLAYCQNDEGCGNFECKSGEGCERNENVFNAGPAVFNKIRASKEIIALKKVVDIAVVLMHWSREYSLLPPTGIREIAKSLSLYGADVIIGSHPHVIQGHECIRETLAVYSLGNFLLPKVGVRVPLLGEHNTSTADVKEYLDGMKDIFSPTQQAYLFKVKFNKKGIIKAEYLPIEIRNEAKTNCLQPVPLSTKWRSVCTENDLYCFDMRNIYASTPAMLEEQLFASKVKSRQCVKN